MSFLWLRCFPLCVCVHACLCVREREDFFICSPRDGPSGCLCVLVLASGAAVTVRAQSCLCDHDFISFQYTPGRGIAGWHGSSIFSFFEAPPCSVQQWLPTLTFPHTEHEGSLFPPHPCHHSLFLAFFIKALLTGVRWHFIGVWFAFSWWVVMWSTLCTCWSSVSLWRNVWLFVFVFLLLSCMHF